MKYVSKGNTVLLDDDNLLLCEVIMAKLIFHHTVHHCINIPT